MCADSGQVVVGALSSNTTSDGATMVEMMDHLDGFFLGDVYGDGAYDEIDCRMAINDRGGRQIIPPPKNARLHRQDPPPCLAQRNEVIEAIRDFGEGGREHWKQGRGYHKRSLVETLMFRFKTIMGERLLSRIWENQIIEAMVKLQVLNKMVELGMPKSDKVAG